MYWDKDYQTFFTGFIRKSDSEEEADREQWVTMIEDNLIDPYYYAEDGEYEIAKAVLYALEHGHKSILINIPDPWNTMDRSKFEVWPINFNTRYTEKYQFKSIDDWDGSYKSFNTLINEILTIKIDYEIEKQKEAEWYDGWLVHQELKYRT